MQIEPFVINNYFLPALAFTQVKLAWLFPAALGHWGFAGLLWSSVEFGWQSCNFLSMLEDTPLLRALVVAEDDRSVIRRWKEFSGAWLSSCW